MSSIVFIFSGPISRLYCPLFIDLDHSTKPAYQSKVLVPIVSL